MRQIPLYARLLFNGLRYRVLKLTGRHGKLQSISLEVTHRCMCRCVMCNIWKIPREVPDLSLEEITKLLSSPELCSLREIDLTGGEPFLRDNMVVLLTWIAHAKYAHFPQLQTIAITTNGMFTDKIIEDVTAVIPLLEEHKIELVIVCGLDAAGEVHNEIRNLKNAWNRVNKTIMALKEIRESYSNLVLGVKTTIIPQNVNELDGIAAFAREHKLFTIISPRIITSNRFGNEELENELAFSAEDLARIKKFYAGPAFAWSNHREAMLGYLESGVMKKPCSAGFNTVFVRHTGEVFPCPLIPLSLGNIKNERLGRLLASAKAAMFRRKIGTLPECKICTEPGLERLAWPYEGWTCLRQVLRAPTDSRKLLEHMGIDKFF